MYTDLDNFTDIARLYPLRAGSFTYSAPAEIRMADIHPGFIGIVDKEGSQIFSLKMLRLYPFFTISQSESETVSSESRGMAIEMKECEIKTSHKNGLNGLIYNIVISVTLASARAREREFLVDMVQFHDFNYILETVGGDFYLARSLDGTSSVEITEEIKKEQEIKLKIAISSCSPLIPIV